MLIALFLLIALVPQPALATLLFLDSFEDRDGTTVGNGWGESDAGNLQTSIQDGRLVMNQHSGSGFDAEDTRIYRDAIGSVHSDMTVRGRLEFSVDSQSDLTARVAVRANGDDGDPDSGLDDSVPCGTPRPEAEGPPDCWRGDGYGFNLITGGQVLPGRWIQIVDDGVELAIVEFPFEADVTYSWEMTITSQNWVALRFWKFGNESRPSDPTVFFSNGGSPYTPLSTGGKWQIEVKNNNSSGLSDHDHRTEWDRFLITVPAESSEAVPAFSDRTSLIVTVVLISLVGLIAIGATRSGSPRRN